MHWWQMRGYNASFGEKADKLLPKLQELLESDPAWKQENFAKILMDEALFRLVELPRRTPEFQTKYLAQKEPKP